MSNFRKEDILLAVEILLRCHQPCVTVLLFWSDRSFWGRNGVDISRSVKRKGKLQMLSGKSHRGYTLAPV